jgi:hypothetical protein
MKDDKSIKKQKELEKLESEELKLEEGLEEKNTLSKGREKEEVEI